MNDHMKKNTRILIVEDERLAAEDLSFRMENLGCKVVGIAATCRDAIKLAATAHPDIILMDIQLRGKPDGIETAKRIHDQQQIPVIFTTAYGDDEHISRALQEADPYGFLHKPVDENAAYTMMQIALSRFANDQIVMHINQLLLVKDSIFSSINTSMSQAEITEQVRQALNTSDLFDKSWIVIWSLDMKERFSGYNGLDQKVFDKYLSALDLSKLKRQRSFGDDKLMSELIGKHAYCAPIWMEKNTCGVSGFTCSCDAEKNETEISIINDIAQVISQTVYSARIQKEKLAAQHLVAESESRLKAIVEKSSTGIYLIDDQFCFEYVNDRLCEIVGFERDELLGFPFTSFLGKSRNLVAERYKARQAGEDLPSQYEIDIVRKTGEVRDLIVSANSFKDADGNPKTAGHLLDITDQKQTNLQLRKLSQAVEQSPVMTVITDIDGNIEFVNSEFTRATGYTAEEVLGENPRILSSGQHDKAFYKDMWDTIKSGDIWTGELTNRKKNGVITWEKISISPIRDASGTITHFVAVKEDISQNKAKQEEVLKNQKLRDILYEITSAAIKASDVSILYEKIFKYIKEIISTSNFFMAMLNTDDNSIYFPFDRDYFETEMPESIPCDPSKSLTAKVIVTGKTLHLRSSEISELIRDDQVSLVGDVPSVWLGIPLRVNNEIIGAFVLQEYDGIKHYDNEDVRMLNLAAGQVALTIDRARKDDALRKLADEFSNANDMKELLLDVITHDLRNPAGVISSISEMLDATDSDNELVEILKGSSDSLLKVIENATVLSKLSIGESIAKEEIDLVAMLTKVSGEFDSQLATHGMKLKLSMPESLIVEINPILSEIPKNYLSNAIRYASGAQELELILGKEDGRTVLRVNDSGEPIPEDKREKIFHRSIQLNGDQKQGRGLGLAIVKRIADAHNAEVGVEVSPSGGNSFFLKL